MKSHFFTITFLRGVAALMVCLYNLICYHDYRNSLFDEHSAIRQIGMHGVNGAFIFFVISGFIIPFSLFKSEYSVKKFPSFLLRRIIRIEIPYLISIMMVLLVALIFSIRNHTSFNIDFSQLFYHLFYFIPFTDKEWLNIIYWTLAIEFQFYILVGLLYFIFSKRIKWLNFIIILIFGSLSLIIDDNRFVFHYSAIFAMGITLFLIMAEMIDKMLGIAALAFFTCVIDASNSFEIELFCVFTCMMIYFTDIKSKKLNFFGKISYSNYLTHGIIGGNILYLLLPKFQSAMAHAALFFLALVSVILFSCIFWKFIENPAKKFSKKIDLS